MKPSLKHPSTNTVEMNNINLLFDYRGVISAQQFKRGIYIISVICGLLIILHSFRTFDYIIIGSNKWSIDQSIIETIFRSFIPSFIYLGFIVFYCSLVLSIKRGRSINLSLFKRVIYGILIYLSFMGAYFVIISLLPAISSFPQKNNYLNNVYTYPLYITYTVSFCFIIVGYFIMVNLSRNKGNESTHYQILTSDTNYRVTIPLFISIFIIGTIYYGGIYIFNPNLSFIEQAILTEIRDTIIYILTAWLSFRIIVPNYKESNIQVSLFDNQIIRLLFDWKGTITKHEFWCGIVIISICTLYFFKVTPWQVFESFLVSNNYQGEGFTKSMALYSSLNQFKPSFFPYESIIFYSSILIFIKRCRAFQYNIFWGYTIGIIFYLTVVSFYAVINLSKEVEINTDSPYFTYLITCCLLFIICFFISIIGIIFFSQESKYENDPYQTPKSSLRYILNNGLLLFSYFLYICMANLLNYDSLNNNLYLLVSILVCLIYIVIFVILSMNKLNNSGINKNIVPIAVTIFLISGITYYILHEYGFFIDSPNSYALGHFITSLITSAMVAFSCLLLMLPSKQEINFNKYIL